MMMNDKSIELFLLLALFLRGYSFNEKNENDFKKVKTRRWIEVL
jgi:hypothetical protein